jgi:hypothetical protein
MLRAKGLAVALLLVAGCGSSGSGVPQNDVCVSRCETKGIACGVEDHAALVRCGVLCASNPSDVQLICIEALGCADFVSAAMPCGLPIDAGVADAGPVDAGNDGP